MNSSTRHSARTGLTAALALTTILAALAGCDARDRAGGGADQDVTVLSFAQPNDSEPPEQLVAWADQVSELSDGSLEIEFENGWRHGEPTYESATIDDVRTGKADLSWVGARALDRAGITSFQALLAPMLVDSQDLQAAVFEKGIAEEMLADVIKAGGDGVTGIGVLPGPLRKLLGVDKPFTRPADFEGMTVGMQDSGVAESTFAALGSQSKALPSGTHDLGSVDAYEQQLQSIWGNQYQQDAGYLTANLDLWPRPLVLIANDEVMAGLDESQQDALRKASDAAIPDAIAASREEDESDVDEICGSGLDVRQASESDLAELEEALVPVYDELRADPETAGWLDRIIELKAEVGAPRDTMTCEPGSGTDAPGSPSAIDGDYAMTVSWGDTKPAGCPPGGPEGEADEVTYELGLHDGEIKMYARVGGADAPREDAFFGSFSVFRDRVELGTDPTLSASYALVDGQLSFSDMSGGECGDVTIWTTKPWIEAASAEDTGLVGSWSTTIDPDDGADASGTGSFTVSFGADGAMEMVDPSGQIGFFGDYTVFRDRLRVSGGPDEVSVVFAIDGDQLTFTDLKVAGCDDCLPYEVTWESHPWVRR